MRARYLLHALPILLFPNEKRERDFIRWETDGRTLDEDWIDLLARGAAHFPKTRTVVPRRPRPDALARLNADATVILAAGSKVHDSRGITATLSTSMPDVRVAVIEGATHHMLPLTPADAVNDALLAALDGTGRADRTSR
ncbi:hypothetical protein [Rhodococcus sp. NPDC004095]